jgi:branched-chain amino acid transport system substrate-binding protein
MGHFGMALTRRTFALGSAAAFGSAGALAATGLARPAIAATTPIRFGWMVTLTGPLSAPGVGYNRGVTWAADKINAAGGVNGRKIEVITRDTQGDPTKAVNAATELSARLKVDAIFGPTNSGESLATTPILARFKMPNLQVGFVDSLMNTQKYPNTFRLSPNNTQFNEANRNYVLNVLKAHKVAVLGDNSGYGTTAVAASVEDFKKAGADVVYQGVVDANAQDVSPDLLRAKNAGAQAVAVWSASTGLDARIMNGRGRIGWDVPLCGHPAMGSGDVAHLLAKPEYWEKVYIVSYKNCSYDAAGKLAPHTQAFVDESKGKIKLSDTSLWWVAEAVDAVNLVADAVRKTGSSSSASIIGYWNTLKRWPGVMADYTFTPTDHNGFPNDEMVMAVANSERNGAWSLAPGFV